MTDTQLVSSLAISAYLMVLTTWDFRSLQNPWWLTTPLIAGLLLWRVGRGPWWVFLTWGGLTMPYLAHFYGAADYRLLLVLFGLFPTLEFAITMGIGMFGLACGFLLWQPWGPTRPAPHVPTRDELTARGRPGIFVFSLPALVYVWIVAPFVGPQSGLLV